MKRLHLLIVLALLLAGCSGVKNLTEPRLDMPVAFVESEADSATIADVEWWAFYSDSNLVAIIRRTLADHRDFAIAAARVEQLRQLYGVERLNLMPTLGAKVEADDEAHHYHDVGHTNEPEFSLRATLSWEADLWGGRQWAQRRAAADYAAATARQRAMQVSLIATVASAYYQLLALEDELVLVRRTLYTRQENLRKAKLRFEGGLTPETVYRQAEVECATTAAMVPDLERRIAIQKDAICLLMGAYPGTPFATGHINLDGPTERPLPAGLPSELLRRRPDVMASESDLQSALAAVGVSYANRFPRFRISLEGGLDNESLGGFLASPFSYVVGNVAGTILDFGRNKRRYQASIAAYEQARLAYERNVMTTFGDVRDAVLSVGYMRESARRRRELCDAAAKYASLAAVQYTMGVINYIDVLDAQRRYFEAEVQLIRSVRDEYLSMIELYRAVGGGWSDDAGDE